ncbi:hypothetical protein SLS62_005931 [Diatrype stigma]|uniref:Potassium transporter n=1 Tax=Diatrype stigma TaxID=117547 RepID=A0AAN9USB5_9PEZI
MYQSQYIQAHDLYSLFRAELTTMTASTIKIADGAGHPSKLGNSTAVDVGGVYHSREFSRSPYPHDRHQLSRVSSIRVSDHAGDLEDGEDWRRDDSKKKQVFKGTTPLYVFSSTFTHAPTYNELVEVLSVIIWSVTIMVSLKYVLIVLHADNEGEGGTFSCYSLLTRYANITERDPREQVLVKMERHDTDDLSPSNKTLRSGIENSRFTRGLLKTIGVLAVSMVIADGVLTPAQSVLGAVQGLSVVSPSITSPTIVGTSCAILVVLFAIQPLGTTRLASFFAPIVVVWLAFNAGFGIYNLVMHDHTVLRAFSPWFAIHFFVEGRYDAWRMLGGILLAFTGVEALFADLGAFSMRAIQISWFSWCYPCLLLAYIGQAAYISENPEAYSNPFYNCVPPGMLYPSLVVAMLAAIVASQAMITAVFQASLPISLDMIARHANRIVHTSSRFHGQLYVPFLNWVLMCLAILVTAVYSNTTRLGNAYGVCVMFVTFFDTCMVTLASLIVWRFSPFLVFIPWLFFATVDGLYLSSALTKVPDGAWFTITISGILACIFLLWRFGKENQWRAEAEDRFRPSELITRDSSISRTSSAAAAAAATTTEGSGDHQGHDRDDDDDDHPAKLRLTARWGGDGLSRIRGFGIYFDKTGINTPAVFAQFVRKIGAVPDATVFFHLHPVEAPSVADADRYAISRLGSSIPGCYRLVVRHGFMDEVITPDLAALIYEQVRGYIVRQAVVEDGNSGGGADEMEGEEEEVNSSSRGEKDTSSASVSANIPSTATSTVHFGSGDSTNGKQRKNNNNTNNSAVPIELRDRAVRRELAKLDRAYASKVMYLVGKEQMKIKVGASLFRTVLLASFLWIRDNTRAKIANLRLAMDRVVEVGFVKEI